MTDSLAGHSILITGADGFIGSHLTERAVRDGAKVRALCYYNSNGSAGWIDTFDEEVRGAVDVRFGDIRDERLVRDAAEDVDVILHLAALIAIPYSYAAPSSFVETNVRGTLNVLEAARHHGTPRVVHTSTSEVYGTPRSVPITEQHPLQAQSPYAATKVAADKLCEAFALSFDVPVVVLRPFNTYGPRQSARAVIPTILGQLLSHAATLRLGSLHPRRDFTYVTDTVDGFVRMATAQLEPGSVIQLGTGNAVSIAQLVDLCVDVTGVRVAVESDERRVRPDRSEVQTLVSDPTRARELLGWKPDTELHSGLAETATWMRDRIDYRRASHYHI